MNLLHSRGLARAFATIHRDQREAFTDSTFFVNWAATIKEEHSDRCENGKKVASIRFQETQVSHCRSMDR